MSFMTPEPDTPPTLTPDSYPLGDLIHAALRSKEYLGESSAGTGTPARALTGNWTAVTVQRGRLLIGKMALCRNDHQPHAGRSRAGPSSVNGDAHLPGTAHHSFRLLHRQPDGSEDSHVPAVRRGGDHHHSDHHHHHHDHARARYSTKKSARVCMCVT